MRSTRRDAEIGKQFCFYLPSMSKNGAQAAASLKQACLDAVANSVGTAQSAADGRRVIGANRQFASAGEAKAAKVAAAKEKRAAAEAAKKAQR